MNSTAFGRLVAGPVGSGKTHGFIVEMLRRIAQQAPGRDGLRHSTWAIFRQTLKQIKDTILPDLEKNLQGIQEYRVSDSAVRIWFGDIRATILLIPLEDLKDQRRLLSLQLTGAWISECIEIGVDLIGPISGRIGRFPSGVHGAPTWKGIIADTNFPIEGGEWYEFMESPPAIWDVFKQPSGLSEDAENLQWLNQTEASYLLPEDDPMRLALGREFYNRLVQGSNDEYVNRYVKAQYGTDPSGSAVYKSAFFRHFHVVENVEPVASRMLIVGQDFGRNPSAVITQLDHRGRLLVLEEIDSREMGLELHIKTKLRPALAKPEYFGRPVIIVGDPAGMAKSTLYEENEFDMLKAHGFVAYPAPTNDIEPRIRAVENFMHGQRDGGPAFVVDREKCPLIVQGCSGSYRFARLKAGELKAVPDKTGAGAKWSHTQDALQYAALVASNPGAYGMAMSRVMRGSRPARAAPPVMGWT